MISTKDIFLFKGLKPQEIEEITSAFCKSVSFSKGDTIYSTEKFPNAIGFVIKGNAYAVSGDSGKLLMKSFSQGSGFGAAAVFGGDESYVSTIIAKTDIEVLFINENNLRKIFERYPLAALNYICFLSDKIRFLNKRLSLISCTCAEDTVYRYLCSVADADGLAQLPKMTLLSKMLGIGRATLYRCLDTLEAEGKISKENNTVKVIKNEKIS